MAQFKCTNCGNISKVGENTIAFRCECCGMQLLVPPVQPVVSMPQTPVAPQPSVEQPAPAAEKRFPRYIIAIALVAVFAIVALLLFNPPANTDAPIAEEEPEVSLSMGELQQRRAEIAPYQRLISSTSSGSDHIVALNADGTVMATGENDEGQCNVGDWKDIVAVEAGIYHTAGLKSDGTVVSTGYSCPTTDWTGIVAISSSGYHIVGLKADGTVVAESFREEYGECDVTDWQNIVAVAAGRFHTVGLKADGTVVAVGGNDSGQCNVADWTDIVAISAGWYGTMGLKADGTVVVTGLYEMETLYTTDNTPDTWKNIVAVEAGCSTPIGLKADGTVIGFDNNWTDIVAISGRGGQVIGLKSDGTIVARYDCDVWNWDLF